MTTTAKTVRFFWNGLKVGTGPLVRAHFSYAATSWSVAARAWVAAPHVTIYLRDYERDLPEEIRALGEVVNNSDMQTDYFEKDRIVLRPGCAGYLAALEACALGEERAVKRTGFKVGTTDHKGAVARLVEVQNAVLTEQVSRAIDEVVA